MATMPTHQVDSAISTPIDEDNSVLDPRAAHGLAASSDQARSRTVHLKAFRFYAI